MLYNTINKYQVERFFKLFCDHSSTYSKETGTSDRNRFISKVETMLRNTMPYVAFIDKLLVEFALPSCSKGIKNKDCIVTINNKWSVYSAEHYAEHGVYTKPRYQYIKTYANIVKLTYYNNDKNKDGYIVLEYVNERNEIKNILIDEGNLCKIQFNVIPKEEYLRVCNMFVDDRDSINYFCTRRLTFREMVERKLIRKNCAESKIPEIHIKVLSKGKDADDALDNFPFPKFKDTVLDVVEAPQR